VLHDALLALDAFMASGGPVLWAIAAVSVLLWTLILERLLYFRFEYPRRLQRAEARWQAWAAARNRRAEKVREALLSEARLGLEQNLALIRSLVAVCPLLGLLGTVTGMVRIFDVMAFLQGSDATGMAAGVSIATIPTMAGLVVALSGMVLMVQLRQQVRRLGERAAVTLHFVERVAA
jgi:biopolymer transport protein ExbB